MKLSEEVRNHRFPCLSEDKEMIDREDLTEWAGRISELEQENEELKLYNKTCDESIIPLHERIDELEHEVERLKYQNEKNKAAFAVTRTSLGFQLDKINQLQELCEQRGERMRIMREWMADDGSGNYGMHLYLFEEFLVDHPEAVSWFNEDGEVKK